MLSTAFLFALAAIPALAAPTAKFSRRHDGELVPASAYQALWYDTLWDAKKYVEQESHSDDEVSQVTGLAQQFAQEGFNYLSSQGIAYTVDDTWDAQFITIMDFFLNIDNEEAAKLNPYTVAMNQIMGTEDYLKDGSIIVTRDLGDVPMWKYQSIFYVALSDAKEFMDEYTPVDAQNQLVEYAQEFSDEGARYLEAQGFELNLGGGWDSDFAVVMDHFWNLGEDEVELLSGYVSAMYDTMGKIQPSK